MSADGSNALARAELPDQRQVHLYQGGREPGDARHQAEQVTARFGRERGRQGLDQRRRIGHGIAREQQRAQHIGFQPGPEHLVIEGAVDAHHAADALQHEAEAQGNRLEAVGGDEDEHRVAGAAVGQPGRDEPEGVQRDFIVQRELHGAGVELPRGVVEQEAAAGEDALGVDREAYARGRLEAQLEIRHAEIAAGLREAQGAPDADAVQHRFHRADRSRDAGRDLGAHAIVVRPEAEVDGGQRHAGHRQPHRDGGLQPGAAAQGEALVAGPGQAEVEFGAQAVGRQKLCEETVAVAG